MNTNLTRIRTEFGPETRFELRPAPAAPFRVTLETALERLKLELLRRRLASMPEPRYNSKVRSAANEAAALAWVTDYPLLVFPELFEEKVNAVQQREVGQFQTYEVGAL